MSRLALTVHNAASTRVHSSGLCDLLQCLVSQPSLPPRLCEIFLSTPLPRITFALRELLSISHSSRRILVNPCVLIPLNQLRRTHSQQGTYASVLRLILPTLNLIPRPKILYCLLDNGSTNLSLTEIDQFIAFIKGELADLCSFVFCVPRNQHSHNAIPESSQFQSRYSILESDLALNGNAGGELVAQNIDPREPLEAILFLKRLQQTYSEALRAWAPHVPKSALFACFADENPNSELILKLLALARLLLPLSTEIIAPCSVLGIGGFTLAQTFGIQHLGFAACTKETQLALGVPLFQEIVSFAERDNYELSEQPVSNSSSSSCCLQKEVI